MQDLLLQLCKHYFCIFAGCARITFADLLLQQDMDQSHLPMQHGSRKGNQRAKRMTRQKAKHCTLQREDMCVLLEAMALIPHGRLYIRNLPEHWDFRDTEQFILDLSLPRPSFIKFFQGQDLCSAYLHNRQCTRGQLETYAPHLSDKDLCGRPSKRTICKVSMDAASPYAKTMQPTLMPPPPPPPPPAPAQAADNSQRALPDFYTAWNIADQEAEAAWFLFVGIGIF